MLGGMDDLCAYAYQACKDSITVETINEWINFVNSLPSSSDGTASPPELPRTSIFGPYEAQLRNDVFHFLVVTLPTILDIHQVQQQQQQPQPQQQQSVKPANMNSGQGRETLLQIFSRVPFDFFKNAIESPMFQIGNAFNFSQCPPKRNAHVFFSYFFCYTPSILTALCVMGSVLTDVPIACFLL